MIGERCLVCGGAYERSALPGLLSCESCRFTTADIRLSFGDLQKLYSAGFFSGEEYRAYLEDRPLIERQARIRLSRLVKHVSNPQDKRLLEIGSAYGFFLWTARDHFRSVEGVEISRDAAAFAASVLGLEV